MKVEEEWVSPGAVPPVVEAPYSMKELEVDVGAISFRLEEIEDCLMDISVDQWWAGFGWGLAVILMAGPLGFVMGCLVWGR